MNIEESIKQIKTIIKIRKEQKEIIELSNGYCANCKDDIEALETILTAYEKEKQQNNKLLEALDVVNHEKGVFIESYEKEKADSRESVILDKEKEITELNNKIYELNKKIHAINLLSIEEE